MHFGIHSGYCAGMESSRGKILAARAVAQHAVPPVDIEVIRDAKAP